MIIVTGQITNPDDAWSYGRSSIDEVYKLIDNDLKYAVESLPLPAEQANTDIGRPTKGAALTLQGKTHLARKQYSTAINAFQQVSQLGYSILIDYAQVVDPVFKNHIELAFENHRWFDLKRTMNNSELAAFLNTYGKREMENPTTPERASMAFAADDFEFVEYEVFLPIPSREIRLNPNLKQTDGYN